MRGLALLALSALLLPACFDEDVAGIEVTSPEFEEGGTVPDKYSCIGENISPPLQWSGVPAGTEFLTLVVDDPDAPSGTVVHWRVGEIKPAWTGVPEGAAPPDATVFKEYSGMCPPPGETHRYRFTVTATGGSTEAKGTLTAMFRRP